MVLIIIYISSWCTTSTGVWKVWCVYSQVASEPRQYGKEINNKLIILMHTTTHKLHLCVWAGHQALSSLHIWVWGQGHLGMRPSVLIYTLLWLDSHHSEVIKGCLYYEYCYQPHLHIPLTIRSSDKCIHETFWTQWWLVSSSFPPSFPVPPPLSFLWSLCVTMTSTRPLPPYPLHFKLTFSQWATRTTSSQWFLLGD